MRAEELNLLFSILGIQELKPLSKKEKEMMEKVLSEIKNLVNRDLTLNAEKYWIEASNEYVSIMIMKTDSKIRVYVITNPGLEIRKLSSEKLTEYREKLDKLGSKYGIRWLGSLEPIIYAVEYSSFEGLEKSIENVAKIIKSVLEGIKEVCGIRVSNTSAIGKLKVLS